MNQRNFIRSHLIVHGMFTFKLLSILCLLCISTSILISCQQPEPVMVNVREKDTNKTGKRYYEDWKKMEVRTVATLKGYKQKNIPIGRYNDRTDISREKTGYYYITQVDGKWWTVSPDGHPMMSIGINSLNLRASDRVLHTYCVK